MHQKIIFADQLRALAVIFVVFAHYFGVFWFDPNVPSYINSSPHSMGIEIPKFVNFIIFTNIPYLNWGPLGVDIFFLISGFVIPISLARYDRKTFIVRRFFRLYPTYFISFSFVILMLYISSLYFSNNFYYNWKNIAYHSIIGLREIMDIPSIDLVTWTLEVELKFYFLTAALLPLFKRTSLWVFLIPFFLSLIIFLMISLLSIHRYELIPIIYMFIGTTFYYNIKGRITNTFTMFLSILFLFLFSILYFYSGKGILSSEYIGQMIMNGSYGFTIFSISYIYRKKFKFNIYIYFISRVSYPFYVIHSIGGYVTMVILIDNGVAPSISIFITLVFILLISYMLHIYVETPSLQFGKKITT